MLIFKYKKKKNNNNVLFFLTCNGANNSCYFFFFNDTATTEIYTLSLHDALPICSLPGRSARTRSGSAVGGEQTFPWHTKATGPAFASRVARIGSTSAGTYASSRSTTRTVFPGANVPVAAARSASVVGSSRGPRITTSAGGWIHSSAARWYVPANTGP